MKRSIVKEKSFEFSLDIIKLYRVMIIQKDYVLSRQIVRSATSIGANINEALGDKAGKILSQKCPSPAKKPEKPFIGLNF